MVGPPRWTRLPDGMDGWLVTRYADVRAMLCEPQLVRDMRRVAEVRAATGLPRVRGGGTARGVTLLHLDPPEHSRVRRRVSPLFGTRRLAGLRPRVSALAGELTRRWRPRGRADLVAEFAVPLAVGVLCEVAGLPIEDYERFGPWVRQVHQPANGADAGRRMAEATRSLDTYLAGRISAGPPESPGVLNRLRAEPGPGGGLTEDQLIAFGRDLLVGGYESTANLITSGLALVLSEPDRLARLRAEPALIPLAVEEMLRWAPSFPMVEARYAAAAIVLGGVGIRAGEPVAADLLSANRDPERFGRPERWALTEQARHHLSFGPGTHHCLGAALARMEAEVAVRAVLTLDALRLGCDPGELEWLPGLSPGLRTLPVRFRAGRGNDA